MCRGAFRGERKEQFLRLGALVSFGPASGTLLAQFLLQRDQAKMVKVIPNRKEKVGGTRIKANMTTITYKLDL